MKLKNIMDNQRMANVIPITTVSDILYGPMHIENNTILNSEKYIGDMRSDIDENTPLSWNLRSVKNPLSTRFFCIFIRRNL